MIDENGNKLDWNPNCDYYDTVNAVSTATLVLWSYCFTVGGLESNKYTDGNSAMDPTICAEDGYDYLSSRLYWHHSNQIKSILVWLQNIVKSYN